MYIVIFLLCCVTLIFIATVFSAKKKKDKKVKDFDYFSHIKQHTQNLLPGSFFDVGPLPSSMVSFVGRLEGPTATGNFTPRALKLKNDCLKHGLSIFEYVDVSGRFVMSVCVNEKEVTPESVLKNILTYFKTRQIIRCCLETAIDSDAISKLKVLLDENKLTVFSCEYKMNTVRMMIYLR